MIARVNHVATCELTLAEFKDRNLGPTVVKRDSAMTLSSEAYARASGN
jgi:hypothetical protein